jgi:hypothetical protein
LVLTVKLNARPCLAVGLLLLEKAGDESAFAPDTAGGYRIDRVPTPKSATATAIHRAVLALRILAPPVVATP